MSRVWEITFDLAGRDEDALIEAVERVLCGPDHASDSGRCLIFGLACYPSAPSVPTPKGAEKDEALTEDALRDAVVRLIHAIQGHDHSCGTCDAAVIAAQEALAAVPTEAPARSREGWLQAIVNGTPKAPWLALRAHPDCLLCADGQPADDHQPKDSP